MIWFLIWLTASIGMFKMESIAFPLLGGIGVAFVVGIVKSNALSRRRQMREHQYALFYGPAASTGSMEGTRYGAAIGAALGHYPAGAIIGAVVDLFREGAKRVNMTSEQRRLFDDIAMTRVNSPWGGVFGVSFILLISGLFSALVR